ncbi:putative heterokaryon incompatibility [Septoria linicola]|nr:putative heterokaryon incompatibility [Septoria linicola]
MRLLNTETYELHEFFDKDVPAYTILSHRWTNDEVTFQDYRKGRGHDSAGHKKVVDACNFANLRRQSWLWVDTCCIDKRSSAELSEAINSMFVWYQEASECYVYLEDVPSVDKPNWTDVPAGFRESIWFSRGWTLQELVAPACVLFCDQQWQLFGHRASDHAAIDSVVDKRDEGTTLGRDLTPYISKITGIPERVLRRPASYKEYSVAQRLSWASHRTTRRIEDEAYCLLGLLDVHMPLLYGERGRAFARLQQEVMRNSTDESILAWPRHRDGDIALLASSPALYKDCHAIRISEDLRVPRLTPQSGLVKLESGSIDECFLIGHAIKGIYAVRLRCIIYEDHERKAYEKPQITADPKPFVGISFALEPFMGRSDIL